MKDAHAGGPGCAAHNALAACDQARTDGRLRPENIRYAAAMRFEARDDGRVMPSARSGEAPPPPRSLHSELTELRRTVLDLLDAPQSYRPQFVWGDCPSRSRSTLRTDSYGLVGTARKGTTVWATEPLRRDISRRSRTAANQPLPHVQASQYATPSELLSQSPTSLKRSANATARTFFATGKVTFPA